MAPLSPCDAPRSNLPSELPLGKVLDGRYKIESVLGQGGMGMVFRATQTSVQRPVAVKTLNPALAMAPSFFERFRREAEMASRLRHPNIITIYDFGKHRRTALCYYVMELLEGESCASWSSATGPCRLRRAVDDHRAGRARASRTRTSRTSSTATSSRTTSWCSSSTATSTSRCSTSAS